ncbi:MAG: Uma2 family endonuclease [Candidatus Magnetomorum sp.]|nr:Uma2 family endonuclease [Candidatus Magnetomorum sp.]
MEARLYTPKKQQPDVYPYLFDSSPAYYHPPKIILPLETKQEYDGMRVSEEEYWSQYYELADVALEWNNGKLEEKPVADRESYDLYAWFLRLISQYFEAFKEGTMIGLEIGFKLVLGNKTTIRKPDLAFIHKNNPVQMPPLETSYKGCFDICFEFLSDTNKKAIERDTVVKKHEYERYGVREYYILDRLGDETAFYYLDSTGHYRKFKPNRSGVIKSKVLKHFQFREDDLYNRPSDQNLVQDPVYRKYVQLYYQQEYKRAEAERKRAEAERKRAEGANKIANAERKKAGEADKKAKEADKKAKEADKKAKEADKKAKEADKKAKEADKRAVAERDRAERMEKELLNLKKQLQNL